MHLERASERAPLGLAGFLTELGRGEGGFGGTSFGRGEADLAGFLRSCCDGEDPTKLGPALVPQTVYWMIGNDDTVVGMVRVRHFLNERLRQYGGHVGYYVRPNERRKGYATQALSLALGRLGELGVLRALVTVAPDNAASIGVVMANGGQLDGQGADPDSGERVNLYWIDLQAEHSRRQ